MAANAHEEIVRFYIPMDEILIMYIFNSVYHLKWYKLYELDIYPL